MANSITRISEAGKKYVYKYNILYMREEVHSQLKFQAKKEKLTMNDYVHKLLNQKACQCPNQ
jgi:predicted HicB family RNase H-like nuclease